MPNYTKSQLNQMNKDEIRRHCVDNAIEASEDAFKSGLIDAVLAHQAMEEAHAELSKPQEVTVTHVSTGETQTVGSHAEAIEAGNAMEVKHRETESAKTLTPPSQNNDAKILTLPELFRKVISEKQYSPASKGESVQRFIDLNPGFNFPQSTPDVHKVLYVEFIAHYKLYEASK